MIDPSRVIEWLHKWVRKQSLLNHLGGLGLLLAGAGILLATWGLCYVVSLFALGPWLGYHHRIHSLLGVFILPLLFWGNARTSREYLSEFSVSVGTASSEVVSFYIPGIGMASNVNPLAPGTIHALTKIMVDCLYRGPRVVVAGFKTLARAVRLRRIDSASCGTVLAVLLAAGRKMSFQEIVNSVEGLNPVHVFPQLRDVEGVLFLNAEPAGLTLSQDLRQELRENS
jgi:hypothetical protein